MQKKCRLRSSQWENGALPDETSQHWLDRSNYWRSHVEHSFVHQFVRSLVGEWQTEERPELVDYWHYSDRFSILDDWRIERRFVVHWTEWELKRNNRSSLEHVQHVRIPQMPRRLSIWNIRSELIRSGDPTWFFFLKLRTLVILPNANPNWTISNSLASIFLRWTRTTFRSSFCTCRSLNPLTDAWWDTLLNSCLLKMKRKYERNLFRSSNLRCSYFFGFSDISITWMIAMMMMLMMVHFVFIRTNRKNFRWRRCWMIIR